MLEKAVESKIRETQERLEADGKLYPRKKLTEFYEAFRSRFGLEALSRQDGEALLETMFTLRNKESMAYWLEFKDDEEFPAIFGSIAGGSALKYGIYLRRETDTWFKGSSQKQIPISVNEAAEIARNYREQLSAGYQVLSTLRENASDEEYRALQKKLDEVAPEVCNLAWGHKYFHMMFPNLLDDYHVPVYQRFHLIRILQEPLEAEGRFLNAGKFVAVTKELDLPMNHLTTILNTICQNPYDYWRIGTRTGAGEDRWPLMVQGGAAAVGWDEVPIDLVDIAYDRDSKEKLRQILTDQYSNSKSAQVIGRDTQQLFNFVASIREGDLVVGMDGATVRGIGRVTGPYFFEKEAPSFRHRRPVEWLSTEAWKMEPAEGLRTTVHQLRKYPGNLIGVETKLLSPLKPVVPITPQLTVRLSGICGKVEDILQRKGQVILYGPPGTGKTYWAEHSALRLAAKYNFEKPLEGLSAQEMNLIQGGTSQEGGFVRVCTFHPAYGYEDFIEGYRPEVLGQYLGFKLKDGVFKKICNAARENSSKKFYLIIDEINRGDIPRIMGELMTILEKNKRGKSLLLPISGNLFNVPENVFVIGTMNTADRSIALLDTALRRRFGFVEIMPDLSIFGDAAVNGIPLKQWLSALNRRIMENVGHNARNLQIGHSYFLEKGKPVLDFTKFARIIQEDIIPLIEEYCYEDYERLEKILGTGLVDTKKMAVRHDLFYEQKWDELRLALVKPTPEILETASAIYADVVEPGNEPDSGDSESEAE